MDSDLDRLMSRVDLLRQRLQWSACLLTCGQTVMGLVLLVFVIAVADYFFELNRTVRLGLMFGGLTFLVARLLCCLRQAALQWSALPTAIAMEDYYPELGQQVRTAVEYGRLSDNEIERSGSSVPLTHAMFDRARATTAPLDLEVLVPEQQVWTFFCATGVGLSLLFASSIFPGEWRLALQRTLGSPTPYTTLEIENFNSYVYDGDPVAIFVRVNGRQRENIRLLGRRATVSDSEWEDISHLLRPQVSSSRGSQRFLAKVDHVRSPMEFQVQAGPVTSDRFRVDVRVPLSINSIRTTLHPPAYTAMEMKVREGGNFSGPRGTTAAVVIELDHAPASASVHLVRLSSTGDSTEPLPEQPVTIDGRRVIWRTRIEEDLLWSLQALSTDGSVLPEEHFRIRVQPDAPPRVEFEVPRQPFLAHTLAEVISRIQVTDDFGITHVGIVFQVNNSEERILIEKRFPVEDVPLTGEAIASTADPVQDAEAPLRVERPTPVTSVELEGMIPLEYFNLSESDVVLLHAFAEDNHPDGPQRAVTDFLFIDIRPLRTDYRMEYRRRRLSFETGGGSAGLENLIFRQRHVLNRTVRMGRELQHWENMPLEIVQKLIDYQVETAVLTRRISDSYHASGMLAAAELLSRAEASMTAAVDSLSLGRFAAAEVQERDAHQHLIQARNLEIQKVLPESRGTSRGGSASSGLKQRLRSKPDGPPDTAVWLIESLTAMAQQEAALSARARTFLTRLERENDETNSNPLAEERGPSTEPDQLPAEVAEDENSNSAGDASGEQNQLQGDILGSLASDQRIVARELQALLEVESEWEPVPELSRRGRDLLPVMEAAAETFANGDVRAGQRLAELSEQQLLELAEMVAALFEIELLKQLELARDLTLELKGRQLVVIDQLKQADRRRLSPGRANATESESSEWDHSELEPSELDLELAWMGMRTTTIRELLRLIQLQSMDSDDDIPHRVAGLLETQQISRLFSRVDELSDGLRESLPRTESASLAEFEYLADRLAMLAEGLDRLLRSKVIPRLARLHQLEQSLQQLRRDMSDVQGQLDVERWNQRMAGLIYDLEQEQVRGPVLESLSRQMEVGIWPTSGDWTADGEGFSPSAALQENVAALAAELRREIEQLILREMKSHDSLAVPPEYERLIEQYYEVLSSDLPQE